MNIYRFVASTFPKLGEKNVDCLEEWLQNSRTFVILLKSVEELREVTINDEDSAKIFYEKSILSSLRNCMDLNTKIIIVNDKNISYKELKSYIDLAKKHYYMSIISDFTDVRTGYLTEELMMTTGKVSDRNIQGDIVQFDAIPVSYVGWFFSDKLQQRLHKMGRQCLKEMWENETLQKQLEKKIECTDAIDFWPKQKKRLHVTSKFIGGDIHSQYSKNVRDQLCKVCNITVKGILLTPRTFSCYVKLSDEDKYLYGDQDLVSLKPHVTLAVGGSNKAVESGPDEVEVQQLILDNIPPSETFRTSMGMVGDYGKCRFYLMLDKEESLQTLFNLFY